MEIIWIKIIKISCDKLFLKKKKHLNDIFNLKKRF
jgi:hypothetical protein